MPNVLEVPDPRPRTTAIDRGLAVLGQRCQSCGYVVTERLPRCPECHGQLLEQAFGPAGEVFASTVLRIGLPGRTPPYGLAYLILDDGPRVLTHTDPGAPLRVGSRAQLTRLTELGDLFAEPTTSAGAG